MSETQAPRPVVPFLKLPADGTPYLEGLVCRSCGKVFIDQRVHCACCGARDALEARRLSDRGTLHAYSIVHRSFPGVPVPYVSAVVDLEGGGTVKGNLIRIEPDPAHVQMGMKVRVVYDLAPQKDKEGNRYMAYFFVPEGSAA